MDINELTQAEQDEYAPEWLSQNAPDYVLKSLDRENEEALMWIMSLDKSLNDAESELNKYYFTLKNVVDTISQMIDLGATESNLVLLFHLDFANKLIQKRGSVPDEDR